MNWMGNGSRKDRLRNSTQKKRQEMMIKRKRRDEDDRKMERPVSPNPLTLFNFTDISINNPPAKTPRLEGGKEKARAAKRLRDDTKAQATPISMFRGSQVCTYAVDTRNQEKPPTTPKTCRSRSIRKSRTTPQSRIKTKEGYDLPSTPRQKRIPVGGRDGPSTATKEDAGDAEKCSKVRRPLIPVEEQEEEPPSPSTSDAEERKCLQVLEVTVSLPKTSKRRSKKGTEDAKKTLAVVKETIRTGMQHGSLGFVPNSVGHHGGSGNIVNSGGNYHQQIPALLPNSVPVNAHPHAFQQPQQQQPIHQAQQMMAPPAQPHPVQGLAPQGVSSSVPPLHLAGIQGVTQLLAELPLPSATENESRMSLIPSPQMFHIARQLLGSTDPTFAAELAAILARSDTTAIALKEPYNRYQESNNPNEMQHPLIQTILSHNPAVFAAPQSTQVTNTSSMSAPTNVSSGGSGGEPQRPQSPKPAQRAEEASELSQKMPPSATSVQSDGSSPGTPSSSVSADVGSHHNKPPGRSRDQTQLRQQIVSVGKQPRAHNQRKKKDMVSELFDSLTPDAAYFQTGNRRKRQPPKSYTEKQFDRLQDPNASPLRPESPTETGSPTYFQKKGRKRGREEDSPEEYERPITPQETIKQREQEWNDIMKKRKAKYKRRKKDDYRYVDPEELVENETYKNFTMGIDAVFDAVEEFDIAGGEDEDEIPAELLIPKASLTDLCREAQRLKSMGAMCKVPLDKLVKLLTILEKNVKDATQLILVLDHHGKSVDDDEDETYNELVTERIMRSADAALTTLTIMTSPGMPKQVYLEDAIERAIQLAKFQLNNLVYPAYDPTHRIKSNKKDTPSKRGRKASKKANKSNIVHALYNRLTELVSCFAELVDMQPLTDTAILMMTTPLAVGPFFVEGICDLQLNSLRLATIIFKKYPKHRELIIQDILGSMHRLPSNKNKTYRLNSEDYIQMVTALILQLVQAVVEVPSTTERHHHRIAEEEEDEDISRRKRTAGSGGQQPGLQEADSSISSAYESAMKFGMAFLQGFLAKCTAKSEDDYRQLFDAFIKDLLAAVHKPEWPAAEVLLELTGKLLIQHFNNKNLDISLRSASMDYLGQVASQLRKNAKKGIEDNTLDQVIALLTQEDDEDDYENAFHRSKGKRTKIEEPSEDKMQILERALIDYLLEAEASDPTIEYARHFYIAQWYREVTASVERTLKSKGGSSIGGKTEGGGDVGSRTAAEHDECQRAVSQAAATKQFLLQLVDRDLEVDSEWDESGQKLNECQATFIVKYLASQRTFHQAFEKYLQSILRVIPETAINMRTKAMKALSLVIDADPEILTRSDIKGVVFTRMTDSSASVREATLDLIGKYIMQKPVLIDAYYPVIINRILDTGLTVRKRVIKTLQEICIRKPDYDRLPEICIKIIRRVTDEEGIRKLVYDTFTSLWFKPGNDRDTATLFKKVIQMTDVVSEAMKDPTSWEQLETLITNILKGEPKKGDVDKSILAAARQIVTCLVDNVLTLEQRMAGGQAPEKQNTLLACLSTLLLISKAQPSLMVPHVQMLESYLSMTLGNQKDVQVLQKVINIIEKVVPLLERPSQDFLQQVLEALFRIIGMCSHPPLIVASVVCASSIIVKQKFKAKGVYDTFIKFFHAASRLKTEVESNYAEFVSVQKKIKTLIRSLYVLGLMCRYFDIDAEIPDKNPKLTEQVFNLLMFFTKLKSDEIQGRALNALGNFCASHVDYLVKQELKDMYISLLAGVRGSSQKIAVMNNLEVFLHEEEKKQMESYESWQKHKDQEDLKEMGEASGGMGGAVIQSYLNRVMHSYFSPEDEVRVAASRVICCTLHQGLITPTTAIATLIAMSSDVLEGIRLKSDVQLKEIDSKYGSGYVASKASTGVRHSFKLHEQLMEARKKITIEMIKANPNVQHNPNIPVAFNPLEFLVRGYRVPDIEHKILNQGPIKHAGGTAQAYISHLYSLLRGNRNQRRNFLSALLRLFDESAKMKLEEQIYLADNVAALPFQVLEEPLYVMYEAEKQISLSGDNVLQTFKENLLPKFQDNFPTPDAGGMDATDDDDASPDHIYLRLPRDIEPLHQCMEASLGCFLLLYLKNHLMQLYGVKSAKLAEYAPTENPKQYDRPLTRRAGVGSFYPLYPIQRLVHCDTDRKNRNTPDGRVDLCHRFVEFKQMMLALDNNNDDDEPNPDGVQPDGLPPNIPSDGSPTAPAPILPNHTNSTGDAYQNQEVAYE